LPDESAPTAMTLGRVEWPGGTVTLLVTLC
jgi:hypothetical protein